MAQAAEGDHAVTQHVELEVKFDVPASATSPSFDHLTSVSRVETLPSQSLDAVYYDTLGHDLAAKWVTLRRRTGAATPAGISSSRMAATGAPRCTPSRDPLDARDLGRRHQGARRTRRRRSRHRPGPSADAGGTHLHHPQTPAVVRRRRSAVSRVRR